MVDMTVALTDETDKPIKDTFGIQRVEELADAPDLTLGRAIMHALFNTFPDERELSADEKWARADLAMRVKDDPNAVLTAEQVAKIKKLVGKLYGGLIIMRAFPMLDPNHPPPELK
jgi:hypothetical protein